MDEIKNNTKKDQNRLPLRAYWDLLSRHILPQRGRFSLLLGLIPAGIALQLINPQIMRGFIDAALGGVAPRELIGSALAFLSIALVQQGLSVATVYLGESVAWTATNALRAELARHCLSLDMGFHNRRTPGELIERIDGDVTELATFFSQFVVTLLRNGLLLVGILVSLYLEDWRLGLAFTLFTAAALAVLNRVRNIAIADQKQVREAEAQYMGFIEEQLSGTEDVRSNGAVSYVLRELHRLQATYFRSDWRASFKNQLVTTTVILILVVGTSLAILSGYLLYTYAAVTIGTVYLILRYISLLEEPIWVLTYEMRTFQTIGACIERLSELRALQPAVRGGAKDSLPDGALPLGFETVSFAYDQEEPVLKNLSFHLAPGRVLGLLGRTGSGKSTLARLIFRLYDPGSGRIVLDKTDLRELHLETLRQKVAMVTQDVQIFRASIRDNLTFFDPSIPDERIQAVIAEVGLSDWLAAQPKGLDRELASGGRGLSAGEAQLLALARVFLRDPGLVILDEASSRLDPATELLLEKAIDRLLRGRTAVVIAHRLGTVHRADEILILDEGVAIEHGPRAALATDPDSRFHHLLQTGLEEMLA